MKKLILFAYFASLFCFGTSLSFAQEHGKKKQKEDPIKLLEEIQKKMAEAENLLTRSSVGNVGSAKKVDKLQTAIQRRLERLNRQNKTQEEIVKELDKFMKRKKRQMQRTGKSMSDAVKEIDKLLQTQKDQKQCVSQINKILESQSKMQKALQSMDKIFKDIGSKQGEALTTIDKLIEMAKKSQHQSSSISPESAPQHSKDKPKEEEMDDPQNPLKPKNAEQKTTKPRKT